MLGNAQMSRWGQRKWMKPFYMTGFSFTWNFCSLQLWLPIVSTFHQSHPLSAMLPAHAPLSLWSEKCKRMEAWINRVSGGTGSAVWGGQWASSVFCVPFKQEDCGHQADIKWKQKFPSHGDTREQLVGALYWSQIIHVYVPNVFCLP